MKPFDNNHDGQDGHKPAAEQRQARTEQQLVARIEPHPGHTVWEFNLDTGEIVEAQFKSVSIESVAIGKGLNQTGNSTVRKTIEPKGNCLYCSALNKKNAIRKFVPMYESLVRSGKIKRSEPTAP